MSVTSQKNRPSNTMKIVAVVAGCVLAIVILNRITNPVSRGTESSLVETETTSGAPQKPRPQPNYLDDPKAGGEYLDVLAERTGGDYEKLSPDDKRWVGSMAGKHSRQLLRVTAERIKREKAAEKKREKQKAPPSPPAKM